jgi:hypothetical protein
MPVREITVEVYAPTEPELDAIEGAQGGHRLEHASQAGIA